MKAETHTCCTQRMKQCAEGYDRNELMDISSQETSAKKERGQAIDSESRQAILQISKTKVGEWKKDWLQALWCLEIKQLSENQVSGLKEHLLSTSYSLLPVLGAEEFRDNVR